MAQRTSPPFRTDHVDSPIRPQELHGALEDRLIREVARRQRMPAPAVGEFRRTSYREVWLKSMEGFGEERLKTDFAFSYPDGGSARPATPVPKVVSRLRRSGSIEAGDFGFLETATKATAKLGAQARPARCRGS